MSEPALNTCARLLKEGSGPGKTILLQAPVEFHQSKPLKKNVKEPVEVEPLRKIDEIRRFSNKLGLTKKSMGSLVNSIEYCGPIRKKLYHYVPGFVGMAYNPFINEDTRHRFFDYEMMKPSWGPSPNADAIWRATQDRASNASRPNY